MLCARNLVGYNGKPNFKLVVVQYCNLIGGPAEKEAKTAACPPTGG